MFKSVLKYMIWGPEATQWYLLSIWLWNKGGFYKKLSIFYKRKIQVRFACYLSPQAAIGKGLVLPHPTGVVIGDGVTIGNDVTIYQGVTIGASRMGEGALGLYPIIGDGVIIYAGAKIVGNIKIGARSIIGANAVVFENIPEDSVAVGVPARVVIKKSQ
jgi:serine O-acetyltransferase